MNALYAVAGISKQAVAQQSRRQAVFDRKLEQLIGEADQLRSAHGGCGVEKMYYTLNPDFMGRDRFCEMFMSLGYGLKRKRNYRKTTRAGSRYFPNLIAGMVLDGPSQVWQSDITYIELNGRFYYAVFITDVFTREIVGYQLSDNLRAEANLKALRMALKKHPPPIYHHSDKGVQYTYKAYVELLQGLGTKISMGDTALENAYAERINGIIKNEFIAYRRLYDFKQLRRAVVQSVKYYNNRRLHNSLNRMTPVRYRQAVNNGTMTDQPTTTIFSNSIN